MMVARAQPRVVIFTQQEQLGALLVGQSHWQWGRSRHRQQPLKNKSDAIEYIIITTYTSMPYFYHISLVPYGRTHRLSVLIASMLQVAVEIANEKEQSSAKARELVEAIELVFEDEDGEREILRMIEELFKDAGVKFKRVSSRGERYSIAEDALYQFIHWEDMPWER